MLLFRGVFTHSSHAQVEDTTRGGSLAQTVSLVITGGPSGFGLSFIRGLILGHPPYQQISQAAGSLVVGRCREQSQTSWLCQIGFLYIFPH